MIIVVSSMCELFAYWIELSYLRSIPYSHHKFDRCPEQILDAPHTCPAVPRKIPSSAHLCTVPTIFMVYPLFPWRPHSHTDHQHTDAAE